MTGIEMNQLIAMSHTYGSDARYVLAGGGNTSVKADGVLYVKASGTRLSNIEESGFCEDGHGEDLRMFEKTYSAEDKQRESEALQDMMDARLARGNQPPERGMHAARAVSADLCAAPASRAGQRFDLRE